MMRPVTLTLVFVMSSPVAHAAKCEFGGSVPSYVMCIADQASANEDAIAELQSEVDANATAHSENMASIDALQAVVDDLQADLEATQAENDALQAEAEKQAIAYVQNVKAFHMNWIAAIVILPVLYILNQRLSPQFDWFFIVAVCWGAAIALHALVIFGMFSVFSGEWEQKQFQNKMDELKRR